ncbi:MAG: VOC family protein [Planctomycetota bacterium]
MGAPLCHFEFMSDDPAKCKAFYAGVFGWEYDDRSMTDYTLIKTDKEPGGGLMQRPAEAPSPALNVYFAVEDIDATLKKAQQRGGHIVVPKTPIPNVGAFAFFSDPEGIVVGIFQA